jgi:hypothetical protein
MRAPDQALLLVTANMSKKMIWGEENPIPTVAACLPSEMAIFCNMFHFFA